MRLFRIGYTKSKHEDPLNHIMTELWSDDIKDLEIKAKIISECAYLPEFFPEFPDKDLPID